MLPYLEKKFKGFVPHRQISNLRGHLLRGTTYMSKPGQLSVSEAGRRGGQSTLSHKGREFYREIGRRGGKQTAKLYGHLFSEYGKLGGRPRRPSLL